MEYLSTFKITKVFDTCLNMYKEIQPDLEELGIKILWAGANADETKVFDITEINDPSKFGVLVKRYDIKKKNWCGCSIRVSGRNWNYWKVILCFRDCLIVKKIWYY